MAKRDYYDVLGCGKDAQEAELKKAYRRLAMKYHPDRNQDNPAAEDQFKEAKEAYEILSDSDKRAAYDRGGRFGLDHRGSCRRRSRPGRRRVRHGQRGIQRYLRRCLR